MAPKKPLKKTSKPIPMKTIKPLPPMPAMKGKSKEQQCGVDGYCCQGKSGDDCCGGSCGGSCKTCGCHVMDVLLKPATWLGIAIAAVIFFAFDFGWHGNLMMPRYLETANLWRPMAEMQTLWPWCVGYHILLAAVFAVGFALMGCGGCLKGAKNGVLLMAPLAVGTMMAYITQPIPSDILQMWALGYLLEGAIAGAILGLVASRCRGSGCGSGGCC